MMIIIIIIITTTTTTTIAITIIKYDVIVAVIDVSTWLPIPADGAGVRPSAEHPRYRQ